MERLLHLFTESRLGRLLSGIGNVSLLGAGIGAVVGAVVTFATPMLEAPLHLQMVAIGGAIVACSAGLGLVRNLITARQPRLRGRSTAGPDALETPVGHDWQQVAQRLQQDKDRERMLKARDDIRGTLDTVNQWRVKYSPANAEEADALSLPEEQGQLERLDRSVQETLAYYPDLWADYARPISSSGDPVTWQLRMATELEVRRARLQCIADDLTKHFHADQSSSAAISSQDQT